MQLNLTDLNINERIFCLIYILYKMINFIFEFIKMQINFMFRIYFVLKLMLDYYCHDLCKNQD